MGCQKGLGSKMEAACAEGSSDAADTAGAAEVVSCGSGASVTSWLASAGTARRSQRMRCGRVSCLGQVACTIKRCFRCGI